MVEFNRLLEILESFLGQSYKGLDDNLQAQFDCPTCSIEKGLYQGDGKHNLEVNVKKGIFKCWACGQTSDMHGSIYKLIRMFGNKQILSDYKKEIYAIRQSKLYELKFQNNDFKLDESDIIEDSGLSLPASFCKLDFNNKYHDSRAIQYLKKRGITQDIVNRFNIGITSNKDEDYFARNRIIIPSYDKYGILNYWTGRDFTGNNKQKYYNTNVERMNLVFNEWRVNYDATINIVEGPFDHLVVPNSLPLLGKVLDTNYALYISLMKYCNANINIMLDGDALNDAIKLYKKLNTGRLYGKIRIVPFKNEKYDPSLVYEKFGNKGIIKLTRNARQLTIYETIIEN